MSNRLANWLVARAPTAAVLMAIAGTTGCIATTTTAVPAPGPTSADWGTTLTGNAAPVGATLSYYCPPGGTANSVWGTDVYSDDSSICTAAVHAGIITFGGGAVSLVIQPGQSSYAASDRNGVSSMSYGTWGRSFSFIP